MLKNLKRGVSDCVVCALSPLFKFAYLFGVTTVYYRCSHVIQRSKKSEFLVSERRRWIKLMSVFVIVVVVAYDIFVILLQEEHGREFKVQVVIDLLFCFSAIFMNLGQVLQGQLRCFYLNCWVNLVDNRRKFGLKTLLTSKNIKNLRTHGILNLIGSVVVVLFGFIYDVIVSSKKSFSIWNILNAFVIAISTFSYLFNVLQITVEMDMAYDILKTWQSQLMKKLNQILEERKVYVRIPIENELKNYRRAYCAIIYSYNNITVFMNPSALMWFLLILLILIMNFYLILTISAVSLTEGIIFMQQFRSQCVILVLLNFVTYTGRMSNRSRSVLSFLNKYPISKLTAEEAVQIECLMKSIAVQTPLFTASDMFPVDIKLVGNLTTTIITYGLVGIQLNAMWTTKSTTNE